MPGAIVRCVFACLHTVLPDVPLPSGLVCLASAEPTPVSAGRLAWCGRCWAWLATAGSSGWQCHAAHALAHACYNGLTAEGNAGQRRALPLPHTSIQRGFRAEEPRVGDGDGEDLLIQGREREEGDGEDEMDVYMRGSHSAGFTGRDPSREMRERASTAQLLRSRGIKSSPTPVSLRSPSRRSGAAS